MQSQKSISLEELAKVLKRLLPEDLAQKSDELVDVLSDIIINNNSTASKEQETHLMGVLQFLSGRSIATSHSVVSFGSNNSIGDIAIGDIAGGNIIKINLNFASSTVSKVIYNDDEAQHQLKLIEIHRKRLYILEEQAAAFGMSCLPHILTEIDDINRKIQRLQQ